MPALGMRFNRLQASQGSDFSGQAGNFAGSGPDGGGQAIGAAEFRFANSGLPKFTN